MTAAGRVTLGRLIAQLRLHRGLSRRALARKLQMNCDHLAQLEHGRKQPRIGTLFRLADALDYEAWRLLRKVETQGHREAGK